MLKPHGFGLIIPDTDQLPSLTYTPSKPVDPGVVERANAAISEVQMYSLYTIPGVYVSGVGSTHNVNAITNPPPPGWNNSSPSPLFSSSRQ